MNLQELQAAIAAYRATATEAQLEALSEMLNFEVEATEERLTEIEDEREAQAAEEERRREEEEEAKLPDSERLANTLTHRTDSAIITVNRMRNGRCDVTAIAKPQHPADARLSAIATERHHSALDNTVWYAWSAKGEIKTIFRGAVELLSA